MGLTSAVDICNLALSHLGNRDTVTNIDTPESDKEKTFSLWYDVTRQALLRETIPSFAADRATVARLSVDPEFGYSYAYEYPSYALRVLGVGNVQDKENNFSVEAGKIYTNEDYPNGMKIRIIRDITDVNKFSPEWKILLSYVLASNTGLDITQDPQKVALVESKMPKVMASMGAVNAQENRPIRISTSRFKLARSVGEPVTQEKY